MIQDNTIVDRTDYTYLCFSYISEIQERPSMYFSNLLQLEAIMHGHWVAFVQLGLVSDRYHSFNSCFADWVRTHFDVSCSAGWALGIQDAAIKMAIDPHYLFFQTVFEFIAIWDPIKD